MGAPTADEKSPANFASSALAKLNEQQMPQVEMDFQDDPYLGIQRGIKAPFILASYLSQG
jgi:hypothetical protein